MASISALAEWPDRVYKLFRGGEHADTEKGIYELQMFKSGEAVEIVVDDYLMSVWEHLPVMAAPEKNAWWVPIAEKAAAKYYGTYENMSEGWGHEALYMLTGMPTKSFETKSISNLW